MAGFILSTGKIVFPAFLGLGITGLFLDRSKSVAFKVITVAAICTAIAWWKAL